MSAAGGPERFGVGMDTNIVTASVKALLSGVNRLGLAEGVVASQAACLLSAQAKRCSEMAVCPEHVDRLG